jgi:hypothetical protein
MMPTRYGKHSINAIEHLERGIRDAFMNKYGLLSRIHHSEKICDLVDKFLKPEVDLLKTSYSKDVKAITKEMEFYIMKELENDDDIDLSIYNDKIKDIKIKNQSYLEKQINSKTIIIMNKIKTMYLKEIIASYEEKNMMDKAMIDEEKEKDKDKEDTIDAKAILIVDLTNKKQIQKHIKQWCSFSPAHKTNMNDLILIVQYYSMKHFGYSYEDMSNVKLMKEKTIELLIRPTEREEVKDNHKLFCLKIEEIIMEMLKEEFNDSISLEIVETERFNLLSGKNEKIHTSKIQYINLKKPLETILEELLPMTTDFLEE